MFRSSNIYFLVFCLVLVILSGCENKSSTVRLSGEINANSIKPVIEAISRGAKTLIVNSGGGHEVSAIKLANVMFENSVSIVVEQRCMSACAFYLFPSAISRIIESDALVSFHNNSYSAIHLLEIEKLSNSLNPDIRLASSQAEELYKRLSISPEVFNDAQKVLHAVCIDTQKTGTLERPRPYMQFQIWIPTKDYMFQNGFSFEGYWPPTQEQAIPLLKELYKDEPKQRLTVYFGGEPSLIRNDKRPYAVGLCSEYKGQTHVE